MPLSCLPGGSIKRSSFGPRPAAAVARIFSLVPSKASTSESLNVGLPRITSNFLPPPPATAPVTLVPLATMTTSSTRKSRQEGRIGSTSVRTGVAKVPDARVDALAELYQPPKITFATVEYIDAPAISKETLRDPAYLASLRVVDAFRSEERRVGKE